MREREEFNTAKGLMQGVVGGQFCRVEQDRDGACQTLIWLAGNPEGRFRIEVSQ
jgi:hypothetical protein